MLMDFYLENLTQGRVIQLPVTPENYEITEEEEFETVRLTYIGDTNIPTFYKPKEISITGIFSCNDKIYKLNKNWSTDIVRCEVDYVNILNGWKRQHNIIRVLIVPRGTIESRLDAKFYIKALKIDGENEQTGAINYTIEFTEYIDVAKKYKNLKGNSNNTTTRPSSTSKPKTSTPKKQKIYTVQSGDYLKKIAKKFYGNSNKYMTIYNANKKIIGKDPNKIWVGMKLVIP